MKLTSQDQLNIAVEERLGELTTRERYTYNKEIRSNAIISLCVGIGLSLVGFILSIAISRLFYGFLIFGIVGIVRGLIPLVNPKGALRSKLAEEIRNKDEALTSAIQDEQKKKHKKISIIWFSFLGFYELIILISLLMMVMTMGSR